MSKRAVIEKLGILLIAQEYYVGISRSLYICYWWGFTVDMKYMTRAVYFLLCQLQLTLTPVTNRTRYTDLFEIRPSFADIL